jgi:DNA-binding NtrC family response regulator
MRKAAPAERLEKIKDMASALLREAESLDHENALAEASAAVDNLNVRSGVNFFDEVRRFEMRLIGRALELTGGNQARAARMLGLGTTTLNYKIKSYEML